MGYAEEILQSQDCKLFKSPGLIHESYNGQCSALGVSVLTIGLEATIAVYYQDKDGAACRRKLLEVVYMILKKNGDTTIECFDDFVRGVLNPNADNAQLKTAVINCSVALKQVIRTYKLG